MQPRVDVIVYNKENLLLWEKELRQLPEQIDAQNEILVRKNERERECEGKDKIVAAAAGDAARASARALNNRYVELDHLITEGKMFLEGINQDKRLPFHELLDEVRRQLTTYDQINLEQDNQVRFLLHDFSFRLEYIEFCTLADAFSFAERYALLCGYLWDMWRQLQSAREEVDPGFLSVLIPLLLKTHIAEGDDLPDNHKLGKSCEQYYNESKNKVSPIFDMSKNNFATIEQANYNKALNTLQATSYRENTSLHRLAGKLANEVDKEIKKSTRQQNYKLYTRVLTTTHDVVAKKNSALQELIVLANYVSGNPSTSIKVLGLLCAIIGIGLLGVSVACAIGTFGASTPMSALGISLGTTMLSKGLFLASSVVSSAAVAYGMGLFHSGTRRGISKCVKSVELSFSNTK